MRFYQALIKLTRTHLISILLILNVNAGIYSAELPLTIRPFMPVSIPNLPSTMDATAFFQEKNGIIWLGTEKGVLSFDGYDSLHYSYGHDGNNSLSSNLINDIDGINSNYLWVATHNGLNRINKSKNTVKKYFVKKNMNTKIDDSYIHDIFFDSKEQMWVATTLGVKRYISKSDEFIDYFPWDRVFSLNGLVLPQVFFEDERGYLWIGTRAGGLIKFNPKKNEYIQFSTHFLNKNKFVTNHVSAIKKFDKNNFLIGTDIGLFIFNPKSKKVLKIADKTIKGKIKKIVKDQDNNWWIIAREKLFKASSNFENVHQYSSLNGLEIESDEQYTGMISIDKENNVWTAFWEGGVHYLPESSKRIRKIKTHKNISANKRKHQINAILKTKENLWVGSLNGLFSVELKDGSLHHLNLNNDHSNLGVVHSLHLGRKGGLWIGRDRGVSLVLSSGEIRNMPLLTKKDVGKVSSLVMDSSGLIWLSVVGLGIVIYDPKADKFYNFEKEESMGIKDYPLNLFLDQSENRKYLYIAHEKKGFFEYDTVSEKFRKLPKTESKRPLINMQKINNDLFLLYSGGNFATQINMKTDGVKKIKLPIDNVSCLLKMSEDSIWLSQKKGGLFHWNPNSGDFHELSQIDGIPERGLTGKNCMSLSNKGLVFASYDGLLYKPDRINLNSNYKPKIVITGLTIGGGKLKKNKFDTIIKSNKDGNSLPLSYENNTLSISFASLSFVSPLSNKYKYRFNGLSDEWIETDATNRSARLSYIPEGDYTFEVFGSNADGVWSAEPATLKFKVLPPLWLTWWAISIYFLLSLFSIFMINYYRTLAIRKRAEALEVIVQERTDDLAQEKQIVEKLLAKKGEEFANVSHEFRTPLTLILGPIQNLLRSNLRSTTRIRRQLT